MGGMKRLGVIALALFLVIGALSSCGSSRNANNASTHSAPTVATPTTPVPHRAVAHVHYTACDQNISAGPHVTCGFADKVFRAFAHEAVHGSEEASVTATSPATGKAYTVRCGTTHGITVCASGTESRIRFPLWTAKVYYQPTKPKTESNKATEPEESSPETPSASEEEPGESGSECTNGTYENSSGNIVCKPEESSTVPAGATARCSDGTYSFSEHRSGTCSYHGGVAEWLGE